jgi:GTPase
MRLINSYIFFSFDVFLIMTDDYLGRELEMMTHFSFKDNMDNYIRLCVVGNVDSGKSTLVGVLTKGILDNGRGSSREKVFNYAHEAETG